MARNKPDLFEQFITKGDEIAEDYENRDYSKAVREIMALADKANQYIDEFKPWVIAKQAGQEKLLQSVITNLDSNGLPKYLSMDDQSRFAIGYYHQREDLYKTTTDKEKN